MVVLGVCMCNSKCSPLLQHEDQKKKWIEFFFMIFSKWFISFLSLFILNSFLLRFFSSYFFFSRVIPSLLLLFFALCFVRTFILCDLISLSILVLILYFAFAFDFICSLVFAHKKCPRLYNSFVFFFAFLFAVWMWVRVSAACLALLSASCCLIRSIAIAIGLPLPFYSSCVHFYSLFIYILIFHV